MNLLRETINYQKNLPVNMFLHRVQLVQSHWHESLEILFLLEGQIEIMVNGEHLKLTKDDIAVLPPSSIHAIFSDNPNISLAVQISPEFIDEFGGKGCTFLTLPPSNQNHRNASRIRSLMARMMVLYNKSGPGYELRLNALALELLYVLVRYQPAAIQKTAMQPQTQKYLHRMQHIIDYIHENYHDEITLSTLQELEHLSSAYISKFFHKYMGVSFLTYLNAVRLKHAERALLESDVSITQLALDCGFPNPKAFYKAFRQVYHETPKNYRNRYTASFKIQGQGLNYFAIDEERAFEHLFTHIMAAPGMEQTPVVSEHMDIPVDTSAKGCGLKHTWKVLTTAARAKELLFAPVQQALTDLQMGVGFEYIRFHGIFDDAMMVYDEDRNGQPIYNFTYIDQVLDFLYTLRLRPFIELGFMPSKLAKNEDSLFYTPMNTSMPRSQDDWNTLVDAFIRHCSRRFGAAEVSRWYFEVWNEPDFKGFFWQGSYEDYLHFYEGTCKTIRQLLPNAPIGGPSVVAAPNFGLETIGQFINYSQTHDCAPDFISFHSYPAESDMAKISQELQRWMDFRDPPLMQSFSLPQSPDSLAAALAQVKSVAGPGLPLHITEYNADAWARNLCHDTCYQAAFIAKNTLENIDACDSFGYWTLSDCMEEMHLGQGPFFGNFGLYNVHGIPKPGAAAFKLMAKLGPTLLAQGEGWFVTRSDEGLEVLLYNYCHFDQLYRSRDTSAIKNDQRYDMFNDRILELHIGLQNMEAGRYRVEHHLLGRNHGSAFDAWVSMGAPESLKPEHVTYLKAAALPQITGKTAEIEGFLNISQILHPHDICLILIRPEL